MNQNEKYLDKLHLEILKIMDEIHRVCQKNDINYFLCAGTLLGAVRHNGFIPWDDDLDIVMPRKDFNKFISIAFRDLGDTFFLKWRTTDKRYFLPFPKVCLKKTMFQEQHDIGGAFNYEQGIFVDIFPMDLTSDNLKKVSKRKKIYQKWSTILAGKYKFESKNIIKKLFIKIIPINLCHKILECIATKKEQNANCYTRFSSQYPIERVCHKIEYFNNKKLHDFNGHQYYIPGNSESILKQLYGPKYMDIPPIEKRRSHYPKKVIFSDGTVMEFNSTINKVSVEDTLT